MRGGRAPGSFVTDGGVSLELERRSWPSLLWIEVVELWLSGVVTSSFTVAGCCPRLPSVLGGGESVLEVEVGVFVFPFRACIRRL